MKTTTIFAAYARQNQDANSAVIAILDDLSIAARQKDRGSYYKSYEGLLKHIANGAAFFGNIKDALGARAIDIFSAAGAIAKFDDKPLDVNGWQSLKNAIAAADRLWVALTDRLTESDYDTPVNIQWFGGNPPTAPLGYMFAALVSHNIHHRAQISQILDEDKIENNFSGINIAFWK